MAGRLEFVCKDFDVKEALGEAPKLSVKITATNNTNEDLYIPPLIFDVKLLAIPAKGRTSSYKEVGWLEAVTSEPMFIPKNGHEKEMEIYVPINSQRLEKMLDIRYENALVGFDISVKGLVFRCVPIDTDSSKFAFREALPINYKVMYTLPEKQIDRIVIMSEQFSDIVEKLKHYELLRFEIPVREPKSSAQKDLNEALQLLHSAKDNLIHGEYDSAMLNIRNALLNHLLEEKKDGTQTNKEKVLKVDIREFIMKNVPTETQDTYEKIITHLDNILRRVRHTLSEFIHEDSSKLKRAPLRQDVELGYFLTIFIVKYLSYQVNPA